MGERRPAHGSLSERRRQAWHHGSVTGSTLYRRLPNGTWAAEREDSQAGDESSQPGSQPPPPAAPPPRSAPQRGGPPPPGKRRRWRFWRIARWAVAAYVAWLVFLVLYAATSLDKTDALSSDPIGSTSGSVWLLVGSDSREGLTAKEQRQLRTGSNEGQRTDTIMLVHQRLGQAPTLVSIPRDSWVTIPEHTNSSGTVVPARSGKVNSAYAYGGAPLLSETIEYNTGLHVDHYMEVGFAGIVDMTEAVGGVEACFDRSIQDKNSGLDVTKGCHTLDGPESLAWVRMRYADPKGDLGRIERQQQYMAAVAGKIVSLWTAINPLRQWEIVNAVLDSVVVDSESGMFDLGSMGFGMARIATGRGEILTVPLDEADRWEAGQSVVKWDTEEALELFESLGGATPHAVTGG